MVCAAEGLSAGRDDGRDLQRRAAPADALPRRQGGAHAGAPPRGIGMVNKAVELAETHGWFLTRQFENEANADIHSRTTAREILDDFAGERLDYWVTGFGTGGTLKGVARVLAQGEARTPRSSSASRPTRRCSRSGDAAGAQRRRLARGARTRRSSRTRCRAGRPDFIPKLTGDAVDTKRDRPRSCRSPAPTRCSCSQELAQKEGIFVGITAGATFAGALQVAAGGAEGLDHPLACCPTPASAISARRCSPTSRPT